MQNHDLWTSFCHVSSLLFSLGPLFSVNWQIPNIILNCSLAVPEQIYHIICFIKATKGQKEGNEIQVKRRLAYGMRSIGQGASSAKTFCGVMNMPPPPKPNAYQRHNKALMTAAKKVAGETMQTAAGEFHQLSHDANEITKCGVSCDGTWQMRRYSSMNGRVTVLSMETGKCLDVEVLSKVWQGCQRHENEEESE